MNESERRWWSREVRVKYQIQTSYYVSALRDRIPPAFKSLESEAEEYGDCRFHSSNEEDAALQQACFYYDSMVAVRQSLNNLFAVGLGHLFDQQMNQFASGFASATCRELLTLFPDLTIRAYRAEGRLASAESGLGDLALMVAQRI